MKEETGNHSVARYYNSDQIREAFTQKEVLLFTVRGRAYLRMIVVSGLIAVAVGILLVLSSGIKYNEDRTEIFVGLVLLIICVAYGIYSIIDFIYSKIVISSQGILVQAKLHKEDLKWNQILDIWESRVNLPLEGNQKIIVIEVNDNKQLKVPVSRFSSRQVPSNFLPEPLLTVIQTYWRLAKIMR